MPDDAIFKKTRMQQVHDRLLRMITASELDVGDKLPAIQALAERFDTSVRTVHLALSKLEAGGYVIKRHGSGTFIASKHLPLKLRETVAVCMETKAHVFGDLAGALIDGLHTIGLAPIVVNTYVRDRHDLIKRISATDAGCFLVHGTPFTFAALDDIKRRRKPVISLMQWDDSEPWPELYRVLTDYAAGGRMVADHLKSRGHRHVLLVVTGSSRALWRDPKADNRMPGAAFIRHWETMGGKCLTYEGQDDIGTPTGYNVEREQFEAMLTAPDAPTAVFANMDAVAWEVQQFIRRHLPHLEHRVEIVGYSDTPWSQAGSPPFTSVNLNIDEIASVAVDMVEAMMAGRKPDPDTVLIPPRLVVRGEDP